MAIVPFFGAGCADGSAAEKLSTPAKVEEKAVDEQEDAFIASNPTLSTSPNSEVANQAVESLTKADAETPTQTKDTAGDNRAYVSNREDEDRPSSALEHTKTIKPTPESQRDNGKPDLAALLAKEESNDATTPPVNSVISPNDTGGTPPTV